MILFQNFEPLFWLLPCPGGHFMNSMLAIDFLIKWFFKNKIFQTHPIFTLS